MRKKQEIRLNVKWVLPDGPEHAGRLRKCLAHYLARSLRPDFYEVVDELPALMRETDELLARHSQLLDSPDEHNQQESDIRSRIAELEGEITRLRNQLGYGTGQTSSSIKAAMIATGAIFPVPNGTKAEITHKLDDDSEIVEVEIKDGEYSGKTGWVAIQDTSLFWDEKK